MRRLLPLIAILLTAVLAAPATALADAGHNPATKKLVTGSWDGEIRIWNADDAKGLVTFTAAPGYVVPTATAAAK